MGNATTTTTDSLSKDGGRVLGEGDQAALVAKGHGLSRLDPCGVSRTDDDSAVRGIGGATTTTDGLVKDGWREGIVGEERSGVDEGGDAGLTGGTIAAEGGITETGLDITTTSANAVEINGDGGGAVGGDVAGVSEGDGARRTAGAT